LGEVILMRMAAAPRRRRRLLLRLVLGLALGSAAGLGARGRAGFRAGVPGLRFSVRLRSQREDAEGLRQEMTTRRLRTPPPFSPPPPTLDLAPALSAHGAHGAHRSVSAGARDASEPTDKYYNRALILEDELRTARAMLKAYEIEQAGDDKKKGNRRLRATVKALEGKLDDAEQQIAALKAALDAANRDAAYVDALEKLLAYKDRALREEMHTNAAIQVAKDREIRRLQRQLDQSRRLLAPARAVDIVPAPSPEPTSEEPSPEPEPDSRPQARTKDTAAWDNALRIFGDLD